MCPPDYYQSANGPMVTHALGQWCMVTYCWYQLTKKCSTSQARSIIKSAMCNHTSCAQVHELPWGHWQIGNNREGTLCVFLTTYIYYARLTSVRFEHSVCHESLPTSFIMLLAWLVEHSLVHWYQKCVTVHYLPKCMSYHGVIGRLVITGRVYCLSFWLHIYIYYVHLTSVRFEHSVCHESLLTSYITIYIKLKNLEV